MTDHYDVIIIGTGAGGGTLAYKLAGSGKRILLLERGDFLPREKENWDARAVFAENKYTTMERWYDSKGKLFQPGQHYYVGGNTKFFGAVLFRMRREDFGEIKHYGGISPAWPLTYDDIEPYYTEAETIYHVRGARGEDPTEPPANAPYPYPAISHEPRIQMLSDALQSSGLQPFHLPVGIRLNEAMRHKSLCIRCETCDGFPCLVNAKSDAQVMCVNPALEQPNVTLVTNAKVTKLETDASGRRVTRVVAERNGQTETFSADIVVVSAGAINSSVLLLKSANEKHPDGLANSSGVVGRHYMAHHNTAFIALSGVPNDTLFQKTLGINDFYLNNNDWGYPLGHIQMLGKSTQGLLKAEVGAPAPRFSYEWIAKHAIDFWLTTEDLPHPDNRVTLHRDGGITLDYQMTNGGAHKRLVQKLKDVLHKVHCNDKVCYCNDHIFPDKLFLDRVIPLAGVAHQCGTVRFGHDPQTSALAERLRGSSNARVTTALGTDLRMSLAGREWRMDTGILRGRGVFGNLPSGEIYIAPIEDSAEGVLVVDKCLPGILLSEPTRMIFEKGRVTRIEGGAGAEFLEKAIAQHGDAARVIAELGIGTNPFARLQGNIITDEKVLGTIHVAIGSNNHIGGNHIATTHIDGVVGEPTLEIDGKVLIEDGKHLSQE